MNSFMGDMAGPSLAFDADEFNCAMIPSTSGMPSQRSGATLFHIGFPANETTVDDRMGLVEREPDLENPHQHRPRSSPAEQQEKSARFFSPPAEALTSKDSSTKRVSAKRDRSQMAAVVNSSVPPEQDKRLRREIANSNERRRMQCINNGFVNLQMILPKSYTKRGEKMSKAAVLQSTVEYINKLEMENSKLQAKNDALMQKLNTCRLDSGGESNDEGISITEEIERQVTGVKELVNMVQHWRKRCYRERELRAKADEDIRRLVLEMQYCPSGCSKREHSILRRSKSPTPEDFSYDASFALPMEDDFALPGSPFVSKNSASVQKVDTFSQCPEVPESKRAKKPSRKVQVKQEPESQIEPSSNASSASSPRQCPCGEPNCEVNPASSSTASIEEPPKQQPLSGFDILFEAIRYSDQLDGCDRSDSGCSEETTDSGEPTKKRRKTAEVVDRQVVV